jgi:hypothetical protein
MSDNYIRICPVCESENAATASRCACGASLMGVDFSVKIPVLDPRPTIVPSAAPTAAPLAILDLGQIECNFADCAQPNPPGTTRCLYCNRLLAGSAADAQPAAGASELHMD